MTKVYNGNVWNIVEIETTRELENFLSAPILQGRKNSSETGSERFTGTVSFEQADNLRRKGDKKSLAMLNKYKIKFDKYIQYNNGYKIKQRNDIHGFVPIVPNAIIGLPLSMINQGKVKRSRELTFYIMYLSVVAREQTTSPGKALSCYH